MPTFVLLRALLQKFCFSALAALAALIVGSYLIAMLRDETRRALRLGLVGCCVIGFGLVVAAHFAALKPDAPASSPCPPSAISPLHQAVVPLSLPFFRLDDAPIPASTNRLDLASLHILSNAIYDPYVRVCDASGVNRNAEKMFDETSAYSKSVEEEE